MSINIKSPNDLIALSGGKVTTNSINQALGYEPANKVTLANHLTDMNNPHATTAKDIGLGDIQDQLNDRMIIADSQGNIACEIGVNGVSTTQVSLKNNYDNAYGVSIVPKQNMASDIVVSLPQSSGTLARMEDIDEVLSNLDFPEGEIPNLANYVKNTDYATTNKAGIVKINNANGIRIDNNNCLITDTANDSEIANKANIHAPLKPHQIDKIVKTGITTNTITLTDEEKTNACDWLGAATKEYVDSNAHKVVSINSTIKPEAMNVSISDALPLETQFIAQLRKTYNICDFNSTIKPNVTTRVHTDLLKISDYSSATIETGYKVRILFYDNKDCYLSKSPDWITGPMTAPINVIQAMNPTATHIRVTIGRTDDAAFTPAEGWDAINLTTSHNTSLDIDDQVLWEVPLMSQGTIDAGTIYDHVTTRAYTANFIPITSCHGVRIGSDYAYILHFYDANNNYLGKSGDWVWGETTIKPYMAASAYSTSKYFRVVIKHKNDINITTSTLTSNDIGISSLLIFNPTLSQGTLDLSLIAQIEALVNTRNDLDIINNGNGTFTLNGTLTSNFNLLLELSMMAPILSTGSVFSLSIYTQDSNGIQPLSFSLLNAYDTSQNQQSQNGQIILNMNSELRITHLSCSYATGTVFNNVTFYPQLEIGTVAHNWEEVQTTDLLNTPITIDYGTSVKTYYADSVGKTVGTCIGPEFDVYCGKGARITVFGYGLDVKAYTDNMLKQLETLLGGI